MMGDSRLSREMAHDLNNNLAVIKLYAQLAMQHTTVDEELIEQLKVMLDQADEAIGMIERASACPNGDAAPVDAVQLSDQCWSLLNNAPAIITLVDREGMVKFLNRAEPGFTVEDFLGKKIFDTISPEHHEDAMTVLRHTFDTGEMTGFVNVVQMPAGTQWYENRLGRILEGLSEPLVMVVSTNITTRVQAEHEVARGREQMRVLLTNLPGMAYRCANAPGWSMEFVSEGSLALTGYSPEEFTDGRMTFEEIIHPDDRAGVDRAIQQSVSRGEAFTLDYRIITRDGEIRNVWEKGRLVTKPGDPDPRLEGFIMDITARVRAEESLQAQREKMERIFRVSPSGIGMVINRDIVEVNQRVCEMTGYSADELIGKNARFLYPTQEDYDFVGREKYRQIEAKGFGVVETKWRRIDGAVIDVMMASTPLVSEDQSKGVIFTALDITEQKRAEAEQRRMQEELIQAQKMETIGLLAGGMAHEFNNTLQMINTLAELAQLKLEPGHEVHQQLQLIRTSVKQSSGVVGQLLAFARKQTFQPETLDLNLLIEESMVIVSRLVGPKVELLWEPGTDLGTIRMDPAQVSQVFLNLCLNARDAISGEGKIAIRTANVRCTPDHCIMGENCCTPGDFVMLSVEDDGAGMDEETRSRIFEPFFTTKPKGKGTGLGLSTVYGIVRQNQGYIEVDSAPGKGTAFRIYFPGHSEKS